MKKPLIITGAVLITILLVVVWLYLLLFGTPDDQAEIFANLQLSDEPVPRPELPEPEPEAAIADVVDTQSAALNQLTTRSVAGFVLAELDGRLTARYVEQGTGHIYDIDLESGTEVRTSGTTVGEAVKAVFSSNGQHVAVARGATGAWQWQHAPIGTSSELRLRELPARAENLALSDDGNIRYTITTTITTGYIYEVATGQTAPLFTVPLRDITVHWADNATYLSNRPAPYLRGGLYRYDNDVLKAITAFDFGLTADVVGDWIITSRYNTDLTSYESYLFDKGDSNNIRFATTVIPEKCAGVQRSTSSPPQLWCAAPPESDGRLYVRNWYQGVNQNDDLLWEIDPTTGTSEVLVDFISELGYGLDVANLSVSADGSTLGFINRHNNTLWVYYPNR